MAYTVLARKYRSRTFDDVIGQKPIATTLVNAIRTGRIAHGFLFTGARGTGKTSMARILAKALNCLKSDAPTTTPCCACDACNAIAIGQDLDVVEIDAASNTGVDNIRELRSNTAYRPARSRFKVYIIDEVHMLSTGAFNALLKTLEEPPEHVKFILATTEIQKVPATIQSRCQRFNFRNIGPEDIAGRLEDIVKREGATAEAAVLRRVARLANGSMRDALSILDQLLSVSPKSLTADALDELLPPSQDERMLSLLGRIAAGDAAGALGGADEILTSGRGLDVFCNDAIETLRSLMLLRLCGSDAALAEVPAGAAAEYERLSGRFEASQYVQMIAMLEELRRNVRFSGSGRALTDAVLVRMARLREWASIESLLAVASGGGGGGAKGPAAVDEKKKQPIDPVMQRSAAAADVLPAGAPDPVAAAPVAAGAGRGSGGGVRAAQSVSRRDVIPIDGPEAADEGGGDGARQGPRGERVRASAEERTRALNDPFTKRAMEMLDGVLVEVTRVTAPRDSGAAE
jgi:DNA polymerase-3 subunit gamma/tau